MALILRGVLPTFLLDRVVAATASTVLKVEPPRCVILVDAQPTPDFDPLRPLLEAEGVAAEWRVGETRSA